MDNINDLLLWATSYTLFATLLVPFVIEFVFTNIYQPANKFWNSVFTFIIAIAASYGVYLVGVITNFGFLVGIDNHYLIVALGFGAGAMANWTWVNIEWVKALIKFIFNDVDWINGKRKGMEEKEV